MGWIIFVFVIIGFGYFLFSRSKKGTVCEKCGRAFSRWVVYSGGVKLIDKKFYCIGCAPSSKPFKDSSPAMSVEEIKQILKKAKEESKCVSIDYLHDEVKTRIIEPYDVDDTYLSAYCRLREQPLTFRLDNLGTCKILEEIFVKNEDILAYLMEQKENLGSFKISFREWKRKKDPTKQPLMPFQDMNAEDAIKSKRRVWIKYESSDGEFTERKIDIYYSQDGYFHGWCHLRNDARSFKLDRVKEWKILDETFERNKEAAAYLKEKTEDPEGRATPPDFETWKRWGGKNWA